VLTQADIPPGGEGEIEVTFNTGSKKGQQKKTITITSNDPVNKIAKITVLAFIEVEFDFEMHGFNFGKVKLDEPVVRSVYVLVKDPAGVQITGLEASSPFLTARQLGTETSTKGESKIEIEITLNPGYPPGKINETLLARSNLAGKPEVTMRLSGSVEGDISLSQEVLRFDSDPTKGEQTSPIQKVQIFNTSPEKKLNILSVNDPDGRIKLELKTLQIGQMYEIDASLINESLGEANYYKGAIYIETDNPEQDTLVVDYSIYSRPKNN